MDQITPLHLAFEPVEAARRVSTLAAERADGQDHDGGFPIDDVRELDTSGLLAAPIPSRAGGAGLGEEAGSVNLARVLRLLGYGNLALGRIYEGHVNALQLIARYGDEQQARRLFADASEGHLFGVWNTEPHMGGLRIANVDGGNVLDGVKTYASGAGFVTRALVTARREGGDPPLMLIVPLEAGHRADLTAWKAQGMRASATGTVDFKGLAISSDAILGQPDDYHAEPHFSGGAWRFTAVQLGGIEATFDAWRRHVAGAGRGADPHQLMRLGEGVVAVETAGLWVERAAHVVASGTLSTDRTVAFVNLARSAVERAGLEVLQLAQRSVGLQGFLRGHPLERISRDLATYLRQPAPDRALTMAAAEVLNAPEDVSDFWLS